MRIFEMTHTPAQNLRAVSILLWGVLATPFALAADLAVKGAIVYTMAGNPIRDGVVVIRKGRISAVGPASSTPLPDGIETLQAAVVTPGLIDAHSVVGLAGYLNQPQEQDQLERSAAVQPELRAIDAYNAREALVEWLRTFGVTTIHTGHGPGEVISGQTMIVKTRGDTVEEAVIQPAAMLAATIGSGAFAPADNGRKSPGTRGMVAAILRNEFIKARSYLDGIKAADNDSTKEPPARDLRLETMARVLNREMPLLVTAQQHQDISTALRIAEEFNIKLVLDGAAEAYLLIDEIKAAGVPVVLHPQMKRPGGEARNVSFTTAAKLIEAGIPVAFQSGYESYVPKTRVVLFEAAMTLPYGLTADKALAAITIEAARILGIDDRVGSIEPGKDGDLALFDGDPFEYTSHALGTIIEGEVVSRVRK